MIRPTPFSLAALSVILVGCGAAESDNLRNARKEKIDEAWQLIDRFYFDPTFNQQDWQAVRQAYLGRTYSSDKAAYDAIKEMVALLGDPESRYFTQEEFSALPAIEDASAADITTPTSSAVQYQPMAVDGAAIGYIRVPQLAADTPNEISAAIGELDAQLVDGYVLDLRSNPGGFLDSAVEIAKLWLETGPIATLNRRGTVSNAETDGTDFMTDQPLAVLVNGTTGNGSELIAAALQEQQRAVIVGTQTQGINLVRTTRPLSGDGSGLVLTVGKWYPPSGSDIEGIGIQPDIVAADVAPQQFGTDADSQLQAAVKALLSAPATAP